MQKDSFKDQLRRTSRRDLWVTLVPVALLIGLAFAAAFYFIKPAPPHSLVLALAPEEGGARYFARQYQELLARDGVTLTLRTTPGSLDSLALLASHEGEADIAFFQSGVTTAQKVHHVVSLGALSYSPLWVFYRGEPIEDVRDLRGKRLAVGPEGSGSRLLATTLLEANGALQAPTELLPLERDEAIEQLKQGKLDAVFLMAPAESPRVQGLVSTPGVRLLSFTRADAYVRRFPYLTRLVLPRGVFDLAADLPPQDVVLLAPTTTLMARSSLHPALAYLLLRAASEIHGDSGLLNHADEFPAPRETGFHLSSEARRYYQSGVPVLQRYLPFWAANLVDRLWVMLVPIIAVVVPLGRLLPSLFLWRVRSRIFRWYASLKEIELQLEENPGRKLLEDMLVRLDAAEYAVNRISVPLSYTENLYIFREHIDIVRRRILRRLADTPEADKPPAPLPT